MDKPRKQAAEYSPLHKRGVPSEGSEDASGCSESPKIFATPKLRRKIHSKRYQERAKARCRGSNNKSSSARTTPSPSSQKPESNLSPVLKYKLAAAELFNSAALSENVYERTTEKSIITSYLSPYAFSPEFCCLVLIRLNEPKNREDQDSRTLCICGPPGVGKTATLNHVLNTAELKGKAVVRLYNGMHFKDTKEFLNHLDEVLCKASSSSHYPSNSVNTLIFNIQACLKKLNSFKYVFVCGCDYSFQN